MAWTASADAGSGLVGAEQLDGEAMRLASDALLERGDLGAQLGVRRRGDPQLEGGAEQRAGVHLDDPVDDGASPAGPTGSSSRCIRRSPTHAAISSSMAAVNSASRRREVVLGRPA